MVMFSLTYLPWIPITDKNLDVLIAELSDLTGNYTVWINCISYKTSILVHEGIWKIDKLKGFIAPNMTDLIAFLENNRKSAAYTWGKIHGIYRYLEMIWAPTTLTTSGQRSHNFGPSSSINNDTASTQPVIEALCMIHKSICKCCGMIRHKADACIIRGPKFLPPSLRRNMNQFNTLHGGKPTEPPR